MKPLFPEVRVNGHVIAQEDIAQEAQNHTAPAGKPGWAWQAGARALVIRQLILEEARKMGLSPAPSEVAPSKFETDDEALVRQVLEERVEPEEVTDAALEAAFETHGDKLRAPSLYEAAHILFAVKPGDEAARDAAKLKAEAVMKTACDNPKQFGELAREHSDCSSKANGGALGQMSSGDTVPEFDAAMARIEVGAIHPELIETQFGFHIIRLDARAEGAPLPFESAKNILLPAMERAAWAQAANRFTQELVNTAEITGVRFSALAA